MTVAIETANAHRIPRPPDLLPGRPDAIVDLQSADGAAIVGARWRYSDARVEEIDFVALRAGRKIQYDGAAMRVTNVPASGPDPNDFLRREPRQGWSL